MDIIRISTNIVFSYLSMTIILALVIINLCSSFFNVESVFYQLNLELVLLVLTDQINFNLLEAVIHVRETSLKVGGNCN